MMEESDSDTDSDLDWVRISRRGVEKTTFKICHYMLPGAYPVNAIKNTNNKISRF